MQDLYISYFVEDGLTDIGAEAFLGDHIELRLTKGLQEHRAGINEVMTGLFASIEIDQDIDIALGGGPSALPSDVILYFCSSLFYIFLTPRSLALLS